MLPAIAGAAESYVVRQAINGKSLLLENGEIIRLASIQAPNVAEADSPQRRGRSDEPLGEEARNALASLAEGKSVTIASPKEGRDRHQRLLGQVYAGKLWLQEEMLKQGFAMTYSFADTPPEVTAALLSAEQQARAAGRGIWAHSYYRVITPQEADEFINRYKLVQGRVVSVRESHGNYYLNFFEVWRGRFAVFISRKDVKNFDALQQLEGKEVRVRGWIHYHRAPMINLTHAGQIELTQHK